MHRSSVTAPFVLLQLSTICTFFCLRASAACYYPNGTADNTNSFLPCNPNGQSMCCATGSAIELTNMDTCRDDGFCIPKDNNGIWRGLCTDKTWTDPACINLCVHGPSVDANGGIYDNSTTPLTTCGDRSLCCGSIDAEPGQICCSRRKGVYLVDGHIVTTTSASATAPTTSATSSSSVPSSSESPSPRSSSNNTGAIVGGVVGGIAGIVAAALAFLYFMIRKNLRQSSHAPNYELYHTGKGQNQLDPTEAPKYERRGELDSIATRARTPELSGWQGNTS